MSGRLALARPLVIEGEFRGAIESESSVVVSETGSVEASIRARSVEIRGAVVGDVSSAREVVIHAGGRLHGDVETPSLVIERGAFFNGRTRMYRPEHALRVAAPATARAS
jgi:cytoskeletal protein CcmA (bactofilin family)